MIVRELITKWGFSVDDSGLKQMEAGVSTLKTTLKAVGVAVAGVSAGLGFLLKQAGDEEQVKVAFTTMLGSAELAEAKLKELYDFASKTPFTISGVEATAKQLIGMGISSDSLIPTMKALGDVSAGLSVPLERIALNYGQIRTQGKLTGRELRDFAVAGVPLVSELAKNLGKSKDEITGMVSKGKIGFPEVERAFQTMTSQGGMFNDLMIEQSKTLPGLVSNVADMFTIFARDLGKELLPAAKKSLKIFIELFSKNRAKLLATFSKIVKSLASFLDKTWEVATRLFGAFSGLVNIFGTWEGLINGVVSIMGVLFGGAMLIGVGQLVLGLKNIIMAFNIMRLKAMLAWAAAFIGPLLIGAAIAGLILIVEDLIAMFNGDKSIGGSIMKNLYPAAKNIREAFRMMWEDVKSFGQGALDFFVLMGRSLVSILMTPIRLFTNSMKLLAEGMQLVQKGDFGGLLEMGKNALMDTLNIDPTRDIGEMIAGGNISPSGNGGGGSVSQKNDIVVNVPAGLTPEESADAVRLGTEDALGSLFRKTDRQLQTAVVE